MLRISVKVTQVNVSFILFPQVSSPRSYFDWLRNVFIPGYFVETDINGNQLPWRERRLLADRAANRIGPARIRQTRRTLGKCAHSISEIVSNCYIPKSS